MQHAKLFLPALAISVASKESLKNFGYGGKRQMFLMQNVWSLLIKTGLH